MNSEFDPSGYIYPNFPRTKRVLVVDDNQANRLVAGLMLEMMGYLHDDVCGGLEAIASLSRRRYDAVLMDVRMPDLDGLETTRRVRMLEQAQELSPVPIIAVTADAGQLSENKCRDAGMNGFLTKPFTSHEISEMIERYVAA